MSIKKINIVTVGGGTGSYTVLSGIKTIKNTSISAIVSMADNGGSTGDLRDELGVLPPGDVRQCLVALSEHTDIVRKLINYRFDNGKLSGHSFGNIFLAALEKVTGSFAKGVEIVSEILKVRGTVIPATNNKAELVAILKNGKKIYGQVEIDKTDFQKNPLKKIFYKNKVKLNPRAKEAVLSSDYIIIGPGNFYESIVPNLIIDGFTTAIKKTKGKVIFMMNLTNKHGHTGYWNASDYVQNIENYLNRKVDIILINNVSPSKAQIKRYQLKEGDGVLIKDDMQDDERVMRSALISHSFFNKEKSDARAQARSFIRHDSQKIAECVMKILK
ncbi:MAG: YvcK family protein [Candidatus Pacebacteria bacterium]|nr:YvcK family protein [Candidatus Paceibacterota bacterium]MCF7862597.1 YvcK family protein [Candidatus Paceibacterota bacterium]